MSWEEGEELLAEDAHAYHNRGLACVRYRCGSFYCGEVDAGLLRHGVGLLLLPRCGFYFGHFARNRCHGLGLLKEPDGAHVFAAFHDGEQRQSTPHAPPLLHGDLLRLTRLLRARAGFVLRCDERGLRVGVGRRGQLHGVGFACTPAMELEVGAFEEGRLEGEGLRLGRAPATLLATFRRGHARPSPRRALSPLRFADVRVPARAGLRLGGDALFVAEGRVELLRERYAATDCWFRGRGLQGWLRAFFAPLNLPAALGVALPELSDVLDRGTRLLTETCARLRGARPGAQRVLDLRGEGRRPGSAERLTCAGETRRQSYAVQRTERGSQRPRPPFRP